MGLTTVIPLKLSTTQVSRYVSGEGVGMAWGGTGVDLSASGGSNFVLAQDASHVISARALLAADIPSLAASIITSGQLALARGGTNADLSATGGTGKFLKQVTAGAAITVVQPTLADMTTGTATIDLVTSQGVSAANFKVTTAASAITGTNGVYILGEGGSGGTATTGYIIMCAGNAADPAKGGILEMFGVTHATLPGAVLVQPGSTGANAKFYVYDKAGTIGLTVDETGTTVNQYLMGGASGLFHYANTSSNSLASYFSGGSKTTGFSTSAGALIQLTGASAAGNAGSALHYVGAVAGAKHYFYDKDVVLALQIDESTVTTPKSFVSTYLGSGGRTGNFSAIKYFNSFLWGHTNTEYLCSIGANNSNGHPFIDFYCYHSTTTNTHARSSATIIPVQVKCDISGNLGIYHGNTGTVNGDVTLTEKYRFGPTMLETNRISLGGTIGSSADPSAGGIALTGRMVFAGAGTASATTSQIFGYAANSHIIYNTPSTYSHSFRQANVDMFIVGYSPLTGYADNAFGLGQFGCGGGSTYAGIYSNGTQYLAYSCTTAHLLKISGTSIFSVESNGVTISGSTPLKFDTGGTGIKGSGSSLCIWAEGGAGGTTTTGRLLMCGSHTYGAAYAAGITLFGNTHANTGQAEYLVGGVAGASHKFYDKNGTLQITVDESGSQFNQYVSGGSAGALIYSNRTSNSLATYISGGSQTTGFTNSAGALIQLQGSGNTGNALYYCSTTAGSGHYFYDKNSTMQVRINENGLLSYSKFGINGVTPVTTQSVSAASTDLATVITLCNGIRTALIAFGLVS